MRLTASGRLVLLAVPALAACGGSGPADGGPLTADTGTESDSESESPTHYLPCDGFHAIHGSGPGEIWVGGSCGMIHDLAGGEWVDWSVESDVHVRGIWSPEPGRAVAVGLRCETGGCDEPAAVMLEFDGDSWHEKQIDAPSPSGLLAVWGSGPQDIWAGGWEGLVLHGDGASWSEVPAPAASDFASALWVSSIHGLAADAVYLAGSSANCYLMEDCWPCGELWRWDGAGFLHDWATGCEWALRDVWVAPQGRVFAVSGWGRAVVGEGEDWQEMYLDDDHRDFCGVWARSDSDAFAVGDDRLALRFGGEAWAPLPEVPGDIDLRDVWGDADRVYAVGYERLDSTIPASECDPEQRAVVLEFDGNGWTVALSLPPC